MKLPESVTEKTPQIKEPVIADVKDINFIATEPDTGITADHANQDNLVTFQSPGEAAKVLRMFDYLMLTTLFLILAGINHLQAFLTMGDWDAWLDWKDRRLWTTVTPTMNIAFPAVVQAVLWRRFRLPLGATLCSLALLSGEWVSRYFNHYGVFHFPINMVFPSLLIPSALMLDLTLLLSRRFWVTSTLGAICWALIFYPGNWPIIAPFHVPVEYNGMMLSIADIMGYQYIRAMPEYVRIIEKGSLSTFGKDVAPGAAFFAAFVCIWIYWIWHVFSLFFASTKFLCSSRVHTEDIGLEMAGSEQAWGVRKMALLVLGTLFFPVIGLVVWANDEGTKNRKKSRVLLVIAIVMLIVYFNISHLFKAPLIPFPESSQETCRHCQSYPGQHNT